MPIIKHKSTGEVTPAIAANLRRIAAIKDEDIDYSEIPELTDDFWNGVGDFRKPDKEPIALRLDADVLTFFRSQGKGYQTRINEVLRHYMTHAPRRTTRRRAKSA